MILLGGNGTYLGIQHRDVLNMRVVDVILDSIILANGTHTDTVCTITVDVLNEDVGGVRLRAEAVITNVDPGITNSESINIVRVPEESSVGQRTSFVERFSITTLSKTTFLLVTIKFVQQGEPWNRMPST